MPLTVAGGEVFLMPQVPRGQRPLEGCVQGLGPHGHPIVPPVAVTHGDVVRGNIDLLDPEPHAFPQAQPGARE
jgi:hypothetical protein